jgi:predicted dehydrogenase
VHPRVAVAGAGAFGKNHVRVIHQSEHAQLAGIYDLDPARAAQITAEYGCPVFRSLDELAANADAAVVATPTITHAEIGCRLMEQGLDVLVEKPIAHTIEAGRALVETAARLGRVLQVGHLERFNPAVIALGGVIGKPLFFEIHRMSAFTPRCLDVDVVLDLMIHDVDIVLALTGERPQEIRAAGIRILSEKVDIANVRIQFPSGCVANLTASRVSTERVRKLRLFQPHEYISLDYSRQDAVRFKVQPAATEAAACAGGSAGVPGDAPTAGSAAAPPSQAARASASPATPVAAFTPDGGPAMTIGFAPLAVTKDEPLRLELEGFFESIKTRGRPRVTGEEGLAALEVAFEVLAKIEEHYRLVAKTLGNP